MAGDLQKTRYSTPDNRELKKYNIKCSRYQLAAEIHSETRKESRHMPEDEILQFIYQFDPVRPELVSDPEAWTEEDFQICQAHFAYLMKARETGILLLAGRSQDGIGPAIVIFEAESSAAAREFMENDPFIAGGLMRGSLHPFRAALVRD
jgi:uncharacterized protein YciI